MKINKPFSRLNRKIRHCTKMIKIYKNEARAFRDEAIYHQAVTDDIKERFYLTD